MNVREVYRICLFDRVHHSVGTINNNLPKTAVKSLFSEYGEKFYGQTFANTTVGDFSFEIYVSALHGDRGTFFTVILLKITFVRTPVNV